MTRQGLLALLVFYLGFHVMSGDRGLYALLKESRRLELTQAEFLRVKEERQAVEHRVKLLSSGSLDLDLLDEQARRTLGLTRSNEVVYFPVEAH